MYVARILYPVEVLGPGQRIGLWLSGCDRKCAGCSNPELWAQRENQRIDVSRLTALIHRLSLDRRVDGMTITGGEPMAQAEELSAFLSRVTDITDDILIYTGYTLEELRLMHDPAVEDVLHRVAVLIDGDYRAELNDGSRLRGSSNQRVHIFKEALRSKYETYMLGENQIQNFSLDGGIVSAGIHRPDYEMKLDEGAKRKGLFGIG